MFHTEQRIFMSSKLHLHKHLIEDISCIDHLVSNEEYTLMYHQEYDMKITYPLLDNYKKYYDSEAYISHSDANSTLVDKLYQWVKKKALKNKLALIDSFKTTKKVLDLGAGTGDFLFTCKNGGWDVSGVEPNQKARAIAKEKGIHLCEDISAFSKQTFDVITLWHVLEHVPNVEETIRQLQAMLSPNGKLVVAVPNFKSYDANYYQSFWAAYDVPRHLWHFSKTSIVTIFSAFQFKLIKVLPMKFDAYYIALISEKYQHKKNRMLHAFWIGFLSNWKAKRTSEYSSRIYILEKENQPL